MIKFQTDLCGGLLYKKIDYIPVVNLRVSCYMFSWVARKGIPKNRRMSRYQFFPSVCWHLMIVNSFKRSIFMRPLSSKSKEVKNSAHANRFGKYICRLSGKY